MQRILGILICQTSHIQNVVSPTERSNAWGLTKPNTAMSLEELKLLWNAHPLKWLQLSGLLVHRITGKCALASFAVPGTVATPSGTLGGVND